MLRTSAHHISSNLVAMLGVRRDSVNARLREVTVLVQTTHMRDARDSVQLYCTSFQRLQQCLLAQTSAYYDDKSTGSETGIGKWRNRNQY